MNLIASLLWLILIVFGAAAIVVGAMGAIAKTIRDKVRAKRMGVPTFCVCLPDGKMNNICRRHGEMCKQVYDCPDGNWGPCDGKGWCNIKGGPTE